MAKKELIIKGTEEEIKLFSEVNSHYQLSDEDLQQRITRLNGFDDADKLFASYIDEDSWPYRSLMFDPRPYTTIIEKSARLIGNKPKGRLVPREGGDELGAYINNELLDFQWEDNTRLGDSMIAKWIMMDQNTRKYGSSFALVPWRMEKREGKTFFDGPDMRVLNSRDVLANPSYDYVNKWFQYREWLTIADMEAINDSKGEPIYKNLDLLKEAVREEGKGHSDRRDNTVKNKSIRGLDDFVGRDEYNKVIEVITELRPDRFITFARKHGVVLRDRKNPYNHGEIPIVHLKYYPLPDDLYGVSELEPVAKQIKGINAHLSAYSDTIALALRPPIHVNPINTRMHTLSWDPEAKWLMNNPNVDVQQMKIDTSISQNFQSIYQVLVGSLMNAWGEQSQMMSSTNPFQGVGDVTATEIKDTAYTRNVRDNMNKIFLSEALKKQVMFWHSMNQQFMFKGKTEKQKIIRIVGPEAAQFFMDQGLSDISPTADEAMQVAAGTLSPDSITPGPRFAVGMGEDEEGNLLEAPKFIPDETGKGGNLIIEEGDLAGSYDYFPDIESMTAPSNEQLEQKLTALLATISNPVIIQLLAQEGWQPKVKDILVKAIEATHVVRDAENYFQKGGVNAQQNQVNPGGVPPTEGGVPAEGAVPTGGVAGGAPPVSPAQNQVSGGGSPPVQVRPGV